VFTRQVTLRSPPRSLALYRCETVMILDINSSDDELPSVEEGEAEVEPEVEAAASPLKLELSQSPKLEPQKATAEKLASLPPHELTIDADQQQWVYYTTRTDGERVGTISKWFDAHVDEVVEGNVGRHPKLNKRSRLQAGTLIVIGACDSLLVCSKCRGDERACDEIICCSGACGRGYHTSCVSLNSVPDGDWYCQFCQGGGERTQPRQGEWWKRDLCGKWEIMPGDDRLEQPPAEWRGDGPSERPPLINEKRAVPAQPPSAAKCAKLEPPGPEMATLAGMPSGFPSGDRGRGRGRGGRRNALGGMSAHAEQGDGRRMPTAGAAPSKAAAAAAEAPASPRAETAEERGEATSPWPNAPPAAEAMFASAPLDSFLGKVANIYELFGIEPSVPIPSGIQRVNDQMGLTSTGTLPAQLGVLMREVFG
jgi:hypothetical protein